MFIMTIFYNDNDNGFVDGIDHHLKAEGMRVKAEAYKNYGDAALVSMVLEVLPHLAGEVIIIVVFSPRPRPKPLSGGKSSETNP